MINIAVLCTDEEAGLLEFTEKMPEDGRDGYVLWLSEEDAKLSAPDIVRGKTARTNRVDATENGLTGTFYFPAVLGEPYEFTVDTDFSHNMIIVSDRSKLRALFEEEAQKQETYVGLLLAVLMRITSNDSEFLLKTEKEIYDFEEKLLENKSGSGNTKQIYHYRKLLLRLKQHYESLNDVSDCLTAMSANFTSADAALLSAFDRRVGRLVGKVSDLREYVTEIREAYQSQVDINQNRLMKTFTVIAAVFMPLQLVTGWYGMNLVMPETAFKWTYPIVAVVCAVFIGIFIWLCKRRKLF